MADNSLYKLKLDLSYSNLFRLILMLTPLIIVGIIFLTSEDKSKDAYLSTHVQSHFKYTTPIEMKSIKAYYSFLYYFTNIKSVLVKVNYHNTWIEEEHVRYFVYRYHKKEDKWIYRFEAKPIRFYCHFATFFLMAVFYIMKLIYKPFSKMVNLSYLG